MNRKDFAEIICISMGCTIEEAYKGADAIFSHMRWVLTLPGDNRVHLPGIRTLKTTFTEQRKGRDFKTGESIKIYESKSIKFYKQVIEK